MRKKKLQDKIVTAELNNYLWHLYEARTDRDRLQWAARIIAVYGLIPDTPASHYSWFQAGQK